MINVADNALREVLKQVFQAGYNSPIEEKDAIVESVIQKLKEKEEAAKVAVAAAALESSKKKQ